MACSLFNLGVSMVDADVIKREMGIDITNDPEGIDQLIHAIGDSHVVVEDSEDISCIEEEED